VGHGGHPGGYRDIPRTGGGILGHRILRIPLTGGILGKPRYPEDTSGVLGIPYPQDTDGILRIPRGVLRIPPASSDA